MATLTIDNEIYERLFKKAEERQTSVDALVTPVLEQLAQNSPSVEERNRAFAEWIEMSKKHSATLPPGHLVDDSRESIYGNRGG